MATKLGGGKGAKRQDLRAGSPGVLDRAGDQGYADAGATKDLGHLGVVDDDQNRTGPRISASGPLASGRVL